MKQVKVGIIGGGRIGQLHADQLIHSTDYELTVISDITIDHLKGTHYEEKAGLLTTDPNDIFQDDTIDAVFICSSTDTHSDFIVKAAETGKHIFCEKPISFSIEESRSALDAVQKHGVKFQVGFNRRYDKHFKKVYETVQDGNVGEPQIVKISSRDPEAPPEEYIKRSGGMFMDMSIHDFDMLRFLAKSEVKTITVQATSLVDEKFIRNDDVDTAIITATFEDGSLGVIDNSRQAVYGYDQRIEVFGSGGVVTADNESNTNVVVHTKESVTKDHPKYFFLDRYIDAYKDEVNAFATAILEDLPIFCTGEDGYKAELLAHAANLSHQEKRTVEIEELETSFV